MDPPGERPGYSRWTLCGTNKNQSKSRHDKQALVSESDADSMGYPDLEWKGRNPHVFRSWTRRSSLAPAGNGRVLRVGPRAFRHYKRKSWAPPEGVR
jgi:hypothetical protein